MCELHNTVHHTSAGIMYQHKAMHYVCIIKYSVNGYFQKRLTGPCQKCFNIHAAPLLWRYVWLIKKTGLEGQWKVSVFLYVILFLHQLAQVFKHRSKNIHLLSLCHLFFNIFVPKAKILPFNIMKNSFATIIEWRTCCALSVKCKFLPTWFVVPECISHMFCFFFLFCFVVFLFTLQWMQ